jgi:hypothetical protein
VAQRSAAAVPPAKALRPATGRSCHATRRELVEAPVKNGWRRPCGLTGSHHVIGYPNVCTAIGPVHGKPSPASRLASIRHSIGRTGRTRPLAHQQNDALDLLPARPLGTAMHPAQGLGKDEIAQALRPLHRYQSITAQVISARVTDQPEPPLRWFAGRKQ